jgi:hypothetical protein
MGRASNLMLAMDLTMLPMCSSTVAHARHRRKRASQAGKTIGAKN